MNDKDYIKQLEAKVRRLEMRFVMLRAGLSQSMVSEAIGIKSPYVSMYLTGNPKLPTLAKEKLDIYFERLDKNGNENL